MKDNCNELSEPSKGVSDVHVLQIAFAGGYGKLGADDNVVGKGLRSFLFFPTYAKRQRANRPPLSL